LKGFWALPNKSPAVTQTLIIYSFVATPDVRRDKRGYIGGCRRAVELMRLRYCCTTLSKLTWSRQANCRTQKRHSTSAAGGAA